MLRCARLGLLQALLALALLFGTPPSHAGDAAGWSAGTGVASSAKSTPRDERLLAALAQSIDGDDAPDAPVLVAGMVSWPASATLQQSRAACAPLPAHHACTPPARAPPTT